MMRCFTGLVTLVASAALALTACTGGGAAPAPAQSSSSGGALSGTVKFQSWSLKNETFSPYFEALIASFQKETTWQRIQHMVWPNIKGMVSVVAIFSFIGAWDDFLWPLIVLTDPAKYTLTVGMAFLSGNFADPRLVAAGTMIALIPIVILFSVMQKHFFAGVEEGAVKG